MSDQPKDPKPYKVGYGRPPKQHQFQPGQSGNAGGGSKKGKRDAEDLMALLDRPVPVREGGVVTTMSPKEITLRTLTKKAMDADRKALFRLTELFLKYDGFPPPSRGRINAVVSLSTKKMPYAMARIMAYRFGVKADYTPQQWMIGRALYVEERSEIDAKIDADTGYAALKDGGGR